jgi:hypothetical protein
VQMDGKMVLVTSASTGVGLTNAKTQMGNPTLGSRSESESVCSSALTILHTSIETPTATSDI